MTTRSVVAETALVAGVLGAVMGLLWWWVSPTEQWVVVEGGLAPADAGYTDWFAADGWFLILGVAAGVLLAGISWRRGRGRPVALVLAVLLGAALVSLVAWALGGVLGGPDPETLAETAEIGTQLSGALGIRALAVVFAPALGSLTLLVLLLASARLDGDSAPRDQPVPGTWVPQQSR